MEPIGRETTINTHLLEVNLHGLLEQIKVPTAAITFRGVPVHYGGPVQVDRGFVLGDWHWLPSGSVPGWARHPPPACAPNSPAAPAPAS